MNPKSVRKTLLASSVALALSAPSAHAALINNLFGVYTFSTDRANFTMLDSGGYTVGGTNDVSMVWDGNGYNNSSDYTGPGSAANVTMSSTTPFFGHTWTAHDIQVFVPGSYTFDVTAGANPWDAEVGSLNVTVGANQIGMHMLFDWNVSRNIDVFVAMNFQGSVFGSGIAYSSNPNGCDSAINASVQNCLWDGPGYVNGDSANKPAGSMAWMLSSVDGNGDGVMGIPMVTGGPLPGFNINFNANVAPVQQVIPVPAAVWLFGSGLLGFFGVARRRKDLRED